MLYVILTLALIAADQLVKFLVRANIDLNTTVPFLPHVLDLTYVKNTGAAFSLFKDHTWLLTLISAVVAVVILAAMFRKILRHPVGMTCLSVVLAGAVGNLIDRLFMGYVTDMFQTVFMEFAVFNVADICIVLGGIATCVYILFFYDKLEKQGKETTHGDAPADR